MEEMNLTNIEAKDLVKEAFSYFSDINIKNIIPIKKNIPRLYIINYMIYQKGIKIISKIKITEEQYINFLKYALVMKGYNVKNIEIFSSNDEIIYKIKYLEINKSRC